MLETPSASQLPHSSIYIILCVADIDSESPLTFMCGIGLCIIALVTGFLPGIIGAHLHTLWLMDDALPLITGTEGQRAPLNLSTYFDQIYLLS